MLLLKLLARAKNNYNIKTWLLCCWPIVILNLPDTAKKITKHLYQKFLNSFVIIVCENFLIAVGVQYEFFSWTTIKKLVRIFGILYRVCK